ncbi:hypothetical protein D9M69_720190 [compost metagenome]
MAASLVDTATAPAASALRTSLGVTTKPEATIGGSALRSLAEMCGSMGAGIS